MLTEEIKPYWLNKSQMAESIGISVQAFSRWGIKPVAKIGRQAFYEVSDVLEFSRKSETRDDLSGEAIQKLKVETAVENRRLKKEQADNLELKNELLRGHSVPAEMATNVLGKVAAQVVAVLEQIPGAVKRRLPEISNKDLDVIRKEIATCRNIASKCDQYIDEFVEEFLADAKNNT